jgi:hypothetical protein
MPIMPPRLGHDYSYHDGGKMRRGMPLRLAMDATPPSPEPKPELEKKTLNAKQLLEAVAAMKAKGMSGDDIVDALMKLRGGDDGEAEPKEGGAMDAARRRIHMPRGMNLDLSTPYSYGVDPRASARATPDTSARDARFPHAGRLLNGV